MARLDQRERRSPEPLRVVLETLAAAASIGSSRIFCWLFLGVVFFIPFAMICAEMGCTYPEQGGIYARIRDAFGGRWAPRASWCYWINMTVWTQAMQLTSYKYVVRGAGQVRP
jgi:amino acid transporter